MIPQNEVALLFRGWRESKARLRVIFKGTEIVFSAYCTVYAAGDDSVVFAIAGEEINLIEFSLLGCVCDFTDAPPGGDELPVGGKIASAILVLRDGFALTVFLLQEVSDT
jgi:hypothetical protein